MFWKSRETSNENVRHHNKTKNCLDPNNILASKFDLLATNSDANGAMYAAMVEHKEYPIYGKY